MPEFTPATITLTLDEWHQVLNDRDELERLREEVRTHREANAEYLKWSLGGGMVHAVFAGMQLQRESEGS